MRILTLLQASLGAALLSLTISSSATPAPAPAAEAAAGQTYTQNEIVNRARALDERVEQEESARSKLLAARAGLMDDLLTGRVRVTALLDPAPIP